MKQLEYPYDSDFILRKKKAIKRELLAREGIQYVEKKIAILGGSTTSDIKQILELFLLNYGIKPDIVTLAKGLAGGAELRNFFNRADSAENFLKIIILVF